MIKCVGAMHKSKVVVLIVTAYLLQHHNSNGLNRIVLNTAWFATTWNVIDILLTVTKSRKTQFIHKN